MASKNTKRVVKTKICGFTPKQADAMQDKLRAAIIATTRQIEKLEGKNPTQVKALKKYRKMLTDANNHFGWSVRTLAIDYPTAKRRIK